MDWHFHYIAALRNNDKQQHHHAAIGFVAALPWFHFAFAACRLFKTFLVLCARQNKRTACSGTSSPKTRHTYLACTCGALAPPWFGIFRRMRTSVTRVNRACYPPLRTGRRARLVQSRLRRRAWHHLYGVHYADGAYPFSPYTCGAYGADWHWPAGFPRNNSGRCAQYVIMVGRHNSLFSLTTCVA